LSACDPEASNGQERFLRDEESIYVLNLSDKNLALTAFSTIGQLTAMGEHELWKLWVLFPKMIRGVIKEINLSLAVGGRHLRDSQLISFNYETTIEDLRNFISGRLYNRLDER